MELTFAVRESFRPFFDSFSFVLGQFLIKVAHQLRMRNHLVSDRINKFEKDAARCPGHPEGRALLGGRLHYR